MTDRIIAVAKLDTDPDSSGMVDLRIAYPQLDFLFDRLAELEVRDTLAVALAGEVRGLEDQVLDQQDEIGRLRSIVIGIGTAAAEMAAQGSRVRFDPKPHMDKINRLVKESRHE